jgi:hypothetical protein
MECIQHYINVKYTISVMGMEGWCKPNYQSRWQEIPLVNLLTHSLNSLTFLKLLNLLMISNMKFPDTVMKTTTRFVTLRILFTLLHNKFINLNSAEINLHLKKNPMRSVCKMCHPSKMRSSPVLSHQPCRYEQKMFQ